MGQQIRGTGCALHALLEHCLSQVQTKQDMGGLFTRSSQEDVLTSSCRRVTQIVLPPQADNSFVAVALRDCSSIVVCRHMQTRRLTVADQITWRPHAAKLDPFCSSLAPCSIAASHGCSRQSKWPVSTRPHRNAGLHATVRCHRRLAGQGFFVVSFVCSV
jgi:hypothetical protein